MPWNELPGYSKLLKAFLITFKTTNINMYWDSIKEVTKNLLYNDKLINVLMVILLNKTKYILINKTK